MYDLLIILPNKYLCDHLTDSTTQFLVPQVCFYALCPAHITSQPSLLLYSEVSRQTLVLSLFWVTCILRAEVPWLAATLECTELRTPRRSPLLPPFRLLYVLLPAHSTTLLFQSSNAYLTTPNLLFKSYLLSLAESHWPGPPTVPARPCLTAWVAHWA